MIAATRTRRNTLRPFSPQPYERGAWITWIDADNATRHAQITDQAPAAGTWWLTSITGDDRLETYVLNRLAIRGSHDRRMRDERLARGEDKYLYEVRAIAYTRNERGEIRAHIGDLIAPAISCEEPEAESLARNGQTTIALDGQEEGTAESAATGEGKAPGRTKATEAAPVAGLRGGLSRRLRKVVRRTRAAAQQVAKALAYRTLSGIIAAHVETGRLITVGAFLDRIGGADLPDGKRSWFGRFAKKAYQKANGGDPIRVWAQHRTTGRFVHVHVYGPIDAALYEATAEYKATRHLLADMYARCA